MKIINTMDDSFMKRVFSDMLQHVLKYYYGNDGYFSLQVLNIQQNECRQLIQKYQGENSIFMVKMADAINQFIGHRYADSLIFKNSGAFPASRSENVDQVYRQLPMFFDSLWKFFVRYINGSDGNCTWTNEDWIYMSGGCLDKDFKEYMGLTNFWYGFPIMCILAVLDWVEQRSRDNLKIVQKSA